MTLKKMGKHVVVAVVVVVVVVVDYVVVDYVDIFVNFVVFMLTFRFPSSLMDQPTDKRTKWAVESRARD